MFLIFLFWNFIPRYATALQTVGTIQAASAPQYFLSVFADESESFVAGLHYSSLSSAQLWVYDDQTGYITARGLELALTASDLDVLLSDVVDLNDDDLSSQRWDMTVTQHIMLLHNGKSLYFTTPKEGIPVRLTATSSSNERQVWIFGATVPPTMVPTPSPTIHHKHKKEHSDGISWGRILFLLSLPIIFVISLYMCYLHRKWIREKVENYMNPPPLPPPSRQQKARSKRKKQAGNMIDTLSNPFGGDGEGHDVEGDVEMFPTGEESYDSEDDDTAPLVGGDTVVEEPKGFLESFRALFSPAAAEEKEKEQGNHHPALAADDVKGLEMSGGEDVGTMSGSFREGYGNIEYEIEPPVPEGVYTEEEAVVLEELHGEPLSDDSKIDADSKKKKKKRDGGSKKKGNSSKKKSSKTQSKSSQSKSRRQSNSDNPDNSDSSDSSGSDSDDIPAGMGFEFGGGPVIPISKHSKKTTSKQSSKKSSKSDPHHDDEDDLLDSFVA